MSEAVARDIRIVLLKDCQTTDKEAIQLASKILHVISSDLKSSKQGIRGYARNVIRRAGLGESNDSS
jgi:hypothetical protein